jgi:hypothetical protein
LLAHFSLPRNRFPIVIVLELGLFFTPAKGVYDKLALMSLGHWSSDISGRWPRANLGGFPMAQPFCQENCDKYLSRTARLELTFGFATTVATLSVRPGELTTCTLGRNPRRGPEKGWKSYIALCFVAWGARTRATECLFSHVAGLAGNQCRIGFQPVSCWC